MEIMKKEIKQSGKLSQEEFEELKKEHGTVYTVNVFFEDEKTGEMTELFAYLKKPDRNTVSLALSFKETDPLKSKEILLERTWLAGDERIKTEDEAFYTAATVLDQLIVVRLAGLKKN